MADVSISKFTQLIRLQGQASVPSLPPSTEDTPPAVNPPGSGGLTGVNQFIQLTDTPATYSGATLNYARVNAGETGLEFRTPAQVLTDIGGIGGTIASGQVTFGAGANTIGGDSGLTWNNIIQQLQLIGQTGVNIKFDSAKIGLRIYQVSDGRAFINNRENNYLSLVTNGSVENIRFYPTGFTAIGNITPTNTLDVNGTARIRTINNLGSTPTEVLVPSATGVISKRTLSEFKSDLAIVPSDLGQEGATDGQVITWNNSLSQWEPQTPSGAGAGLWTDATTFIYRDGPVVVGRTTLPTNATFAINSISSTSDHKFIQFYRNDGTTEVFSLTEQGQSLFTGQGTVGGSAAMEIKNTTVNTNAPIFRANGNAGNSVMSIIESFVDFKKRVLITDSGAVGGNPPLRVQNTNTNANSNSFDVVNSSSAFIIRVVNGGTIFLNNSSNLSLGTGTGTKIGTATNQKIGFWNATPIVQPDTSVAEGTFVENLGGTIVNVDSTFDGYTLQQVVRALRNTGLLA